MLRNSEMQEDHQMTNDNSWKMNNRVWILKLFLYTTFLALGLFVFADHTLMAEDELQEPLLIIIAECR